MKRISTTPDTPKKTILVGTYRKDQLEKWVLPQVRSTCAIHGERNIAVHEVKQPYSDPWTFLGPDGSFDLGDIYLPVGDIDRWGDRDCRDWLQEGVDWWRKEIASCSE